MEEQLEQGSMVSAALSMDEILRRWVGEFGKAQWFHFVLTSSAWALEALHTLVMIFADDMESSSSSSSSNRSNCSSSSRWSCATTVQEFHLHGYKVGLCQSAFFIGALAGAGAFGSLADGRLGRKGALLLAVASSGILGLLTAFAPSFWIYLLLRAATGASSTGGIGLSSFVLATECVGPRHRGAVGMSTLYFFSMGTLALVGLSKVAAGSWRLLYVLSSIPSIVYAVTVLIPFVDESPRWLMIRGRRSDAMRVLRRMASSNKRFLPPTVVLASDDLPTSDSPSELQSANAGQHRSIQIGGETEPEGVIKAGTIGEVLMEPKLCFRLLLMICVWFVASLVYYGVNLNVSNLSFDIHTSLMLNALMEMPAFAVTALLLGRIGRRAMLAAALAWSATFLSIGGVVYSGLMAGVMPQSWVGMAGAACGAIGMFGIAAAYNLLYIYSVELFPTVVRNAALGVATQAGQVGALAAPIIVHLAGLHPAVPFLIFAVACVFGGLFGCCLPETLDQPLLETIEAAKAMDSSIRKPLLPS